MPKVTETKNAFVVSPTFGDALLEQLPYILHGLQQTMRTMEEQRLRRLEMREKYRLAHPEIQALLRTDEKWMKEMLGKPYSRAPLKQSELPAIRDLTGEELAERQSRSLEMMERSGRINQTAAQTEEIHQRVRMTGTKEQARERITKGGDPSKLSLLDFIVGEMGETPEERVQAYVSTKWPEYADPLARMRAGVGPEVEASRANEAAKWYSETFGRLDTAGMEYADAVSKNSMDAITKLQDPKLRTLAYRQYERQLEADADTMKRAQMARQEWIGTAAQRILEQNPSVSLTIARDMATRLAEGKPFTADQMKLDMDWAGIKAQTSLDEARRLRFETEEKMSGVTGIRQQIELQLRVLAQQEGVEVPSEVSQIASDDLRRLMPELSKRVAKLFGLPEPKPSVDDDKWPWLPDPVMSLIMGTMGFTNEVTKSSEMPTGQPWQSPSATVLKTMFKDAGIVLSAGLEAVVKVASTPAATTKGLATNIEAAFLTPAGRKTPDTVVKPSVMPKLSPEQDIHIQNLSTEIARIMSDPNAPPMLKQGLLPTIDVIEAVLKGERPFSDLINTDVFARPAPIAPMGPGM